MTKQDQSQLTKKQEILDFSKSKPTSDEFLVKNIEKSKGIDYSNVVDLYDENAMLEEIKAEELVIDKEEDEEEEVKEDKKKKKKLLNKEQKIKEEEDKFDKEYKQMGGIQHIICSATLSIDNQGRIKFIKP